MAKPNGQRLGWQTVGLPVVVWYLDAGIEQQDL
jgi:hypothetical protein